MKNLALGATGTFRQRLNGPASDLSTRDWLTTGNLSAKAAPRAPKLVHKPAVAETNFVNGVAFTVTTCRGIPQGRQRSATPAGSVGILGHRSGGIARAFASLRRGESLNPRPPSDEPLACPGSSRRTNHLTSLSAAMTIRFQMGRQWCGASEFLRQASGVRMRYEK